MASLVDQIFMQAQAGSAQGQGLGQFFAQGVQANQQQQRINLEKQQLAAELAQLPLKQTLLQQSSELNALKIQDTLQERQNYLASTSAFTNLSAAVSPMLESGKLDQAQQLVTSSGLSNNFLLTDPRYKQLVTQLDAMRREADILQYRQMQGEAALARGEAATLRAGLAGSELDLKQSRYELDKLREQRLQDQFTHAVEKESRTVPADKLAIFRERAKSIQNDLSLLADAPKRDAALKALANELNIGTLPTVAPAAAPAASRPPFTIKRISP